MPEQGSPHCFLKGQRVNIDFIGHTTLLQRLRLQEQSWEIRKWGGTICSKWTTDGQWMEDFI